LYATSKLLEWGSVSLSLAPELGVALSHASTSLEVRFAWNAQVNVAVLRQIHCPWVFDEGWWLSRPEVLGYGAPNSWVERWCVFVSHGLSR
jgi:hypothetical protein